MLSVLLENAKPKTANQKPAAFATAFAKLRQSKKAMAD